jgi:hypothetical protein
MNDNLLVDLRLNQKTKTIITITSITPSATGITIVVNETPSLSDFPAALVPSPCPSVGCFRVFSFFLVELASVPVVIRLPSTI